MRGNRQEIAGEVRPLGRIYCLSGCTAVGKTELALRWAEGNGAEIVNCDSLLFYRGMDIGTAKPSPQEMVRVRHHLIDFLEPSESMDIGRYVERAIETIREIQGRGLKALVTGGSGFYLKAFFRPVVDGVLVSEQTARYAQGSMERGLDFALADLRSRNPGGLDGLDTENPRRVVKALERCVESGLTLSELKAAFSRQTNALVEAPKSLCILERDKDELNDRISRRVGLMLEAGLLAEVETLLLRGIERNPSARNAIGYRETMAHLRGEMNVDELQERIVANTRRLAKKQRTWFRTQLPATGLRLDLSGSRPPEIDEIFETSHGIK